MHFQDIYPPNNWLKITPTNFLSDMELDYVLTLTIENLSIMRARPLMGRARTQVGVLNAENNSLNCHGGKFYDGDVKPLLSLPGNDNVMIISPQKSIYLEDIQPCRHSPYNEEIVKFVEREYLTKCSKPCKPKYLYYICNGLALSKVVKQLDYCLTDEETKCLQDLVIEAKENMVEQPCTKVSYLDHNSRFFTVNKQHIIYRMNFVNPHKMTVYKEFLIFDLVGMVSAIGGTMGLCIGLSFTELLSLLLRLVEKVWTHTRN